MSCTNPSQATRRASQTTVSLVLSGLFVVFAVLTLGIAPARADDAVCADCHADPSMFEDYGSRADSLIVTASALSGTAHEDLGCIDCHSDLDGFGDFPHDEHLPPVNCGNCHEDEAEVYQWHGRVKVGEGTDIPTCADCHGTHDILHSSDKRSHVNPMNLPQTCGRCHEDLDLVRKHGIPLEHPVEVFQSSVHGKASLGGIHLAATCNDCHSTGGTAHRILPPGSAQSSINHFNIPATCGKCHRNIEQDYWEGIHGELTLRGEVDTPVCTDCHGEHGVLATTDPRSPVSPNRVAEATCSPCHESARLNEKYDIPSGRLQSWVDSYHGLKSKAGDVTVANCASCHGAHRILPHTDSTSSIHPSHLQETCGHCHPGISATRAMTSIHGTPGVSRTPIARVVQHIYIIAIVLIIGAMIVHWLFDLRKQISLVNAKKQIVRMRFDELWQHMLLAVTFTVLVITGFALRFSEAWWVKLLFGWEGGFPVRGIIHRVAAVIFILTCIWHLLFLSSRRGRLFFADMWPSRKDLSQFWQMIGFNLGIRKERPHFGRFSYIEKAEYWALVWGSVVMIISGFFMWAENIAVQWFPKGFLDVMLVVHYYEAWLATLAILIWHMYSTVFSPNVYPMNPSWVTGKMPVDVFRHEHPEDPVLKEAEDRASPAPPTHEPTPRVLDGDKKISS